jgi:uncharacterized protein YbbC (DUF1343 family)
MTKQIRLLVDFLKRSLVIFVFLQGFAQAQTKSNQPIEPGSWQLNQYLPILKGRSVGIFANQTSMVGQEHLVDTLRALGITVKKIFAPEHGFRGEADAGENVNNQTDRITGITIVSLYGSKTKPSADDLQDIDLLIFDIQDVGTRFYTYISSLQKFMEGALENNKPLLLLDRPNPNGQFVDGPVLDTQFRSFVGMQAIPVVYGMTIGEYACMLAGEKLLQGQNKSYKAKILGNRASISSGNFKSYGLYIIPCRNYTHKSVYVLPVKPSPNLPNMQSIFLYPSICLFEGTGISLGRGTDKPFQQFGHPSFPKNLYHFTPQSLPGATSPPLMGQICYGYDLSMIDVDQEIHHHLVLKWLLEAYKLYPDKKKFFLSSNFFNKLAGSNTLMQQIIDGKSENEIRQSWKKGLSKFKAVRKKYLIYPDFE